MSNKLAQLGSFAFRHRWWVLGFWIVLLVGLGLLASQFQKPLQTTFSIPGTESQTALDTLEAKMPAAAGASGHIVYAVPTGQTLEKFLPAIAASTEAVSKISGVEAVISPLQTGAVSADGRIGMAQVQLNIPASSVTTHLTDEISQALQPARDQGLQAELGGDIVSQSGGGESGPIGAGEASGFIIAAIVLLITFGSLVAAGMPLLVAIIAVGTSASAIYGASALITIDSTTPVLAMMLGIAVALDYALFIVTRYRFYLMSGLEPEKAASRAIATAGNAVIFAALTVIIALSALIVVGIPIITSMGLAAAATVGVAALVAITLVPALLRLAGQKVLRPRDRAKHKAQRALKTPKVGLGARWANVLTRWPVLVLLVAVPLLAVTALPARELVLGFPSQGDDPIGSTERKAYDLVDEGFGPGFNGPLLIVATMPQGLSPVQIQDNMAYITTQLSKVNNVQAALPGGLSEDATTAVFQVIPKTGPTDQATKDLIAYIRENEKAIVDNDNISLGVTGTTAITVDIDARLADALPKYIAMVVGLSLILLIIVFRSIVVPLKATLGFLLTLGAAFGLLTAFFQLGWFGLFEYSPVISFIPILLTGILFGLAMDYEFFLVSGIHEAYEHNGLDAKKAVKVGFAQGSKVVTAAAIIMIAVFSGFMGNSSVMVQMMGFTLAVGIFIDAFIVRMTIVPAVLALTGKAAWWLPKWLGKILPKVSLEGDDK